MQRRADEIFRLLMEIDRTVVLFDEIDELVREREDEHDAFGRFLTTSMLPKLAQLWDRRKIMYFVATNHIRYFDRAITRSERFDALILVSPPSYSSKVGGLTDILRELGETATFDGLEGRMWESLERAGKIKECDNEGKVRDEQLDDSEMLAKFVLLRWDQLDELAVRLRDKRRSKSGPLHVDEKLMQEALGLIADRKLLVRAPYIDFIADREYPRRDFDKELVWLAEGVDRPYGKEIVNGNGKYWLLTRHSDEPPPQLHGFRIEKRDNGTVRCAAETK